MVEFAASLQELRNDHGRPTYKEIVERARAHDPKSSLAQSTCSEAFKGKRLPTYNTATQIARAVAGQAGVTKIDALWRAAVKRREAALAKEKEDHWWHSSPPSRLTVYAALVGALGAVFAALIPLLLPGWPWTKDAGKDAASGPPGWAHRQIEASDPAWAGWCLTAKGDAVVIDRCGNASGAQRWSYDAGRILDATGRCLTPAGPGDGQRLQVHPCTKSADQRWKFTQGRLVSQDVCVTIYGPYDKPGTPMQTWNVNAPVASEMLWKLGGNPVVLNATDTPSAGVRG
ncbi:ricin-type beta-trefoil lectin domain protein [Streptomyces mirabilis]|uniref:ricin-type beta-trefoil lectin domain protein n=1 Tax=Streptomyces mirabilis TaxID=68239 RepID=UPI0036873E95